MKDFFISYTSADKVKAEWIAWVLEDAGYKIFIEAWDFGPGHNFVMAMQKGATEATRTIVVLSPDYLDAKFTHPEWMAAFAQDPTGEQRLLVPVRIHPVKLSGLLKPIVYIDLVDVEENEAQKLLLSGVNLERKKPKTKPPFLSPQSNNVESAKPAFSAQPTSTPTSQPTTQAIKFSPEYKLGQLDRQDQRDHFSMHIRENNGRENGQTIGFILSGPRQEWPQAIRYKLSYFLTKDRIGEKKLFPELKVLIGEKSLIDRTPEQFLCELIATSINCRPDKSTVHMALGKLNECHIFYRELTTEEAKNHQFLTGVLLAWSDIKFNNQNYHHFLLLICESDHIENKRSRWFSFGKSTPPWRQQMEQYLSEKHIVTSLLPALNVPKHEDIDDWLKQHFDEESLRDAILDMVQKSFPESTEIPLSELKGILKPVINNHKT